MKRFFGAFLIICMVLTSMSVGVSADYTAPTEEANYNTYKFENDEVKMYNVGEWKLSNGTDTKVLGNITDNNSILGMDFKKFDLKAGSLSSTNTGTLSIRAEVNNTEKYGVTYSQGHCGTEYFLVSKMDEILKPLDAAGDGIDKTDKNTGGVVKYTMYAYSALEDGEDIGFNLVGMTTDYSARLTVPASKLYSENGIPHKIDFIFYHTSYATAPVSESKASATSHVVEVWIDGLNYVEGAAASETVAAKRMMFLSPNINLTADGTNDVVWKDSELYICSSPSNLKVATAVTDTTEGGDYVTVHTRDNLHSKFFQDVVYSKSMNGALHSGFIRNVDSKLAAEMEELYTTAISGDRILNVDESIYNSPTKIWNEDASSSNVLLVKKSDGELYNIAKSKTETVEGTFDDYLISVNGVYTKVELAPVSYDVDGKKATVNVSKLPAGTSELQIVVAAYNNDGTMKAIKVSGAETVGSSNIAFTIDDSTFPTDAYEYKVFVFDSLTSAKPLMEVLEK